MTPRLALVSPRFHGYHRSISAALEARGYEVRTHCYDVVTSRRAKAWNKARHELPSRLRGRPGNHASEETVTRDAIDFLRETRPDVTLVVRGDLFTEEFWRTAGEISSDVAVWMYDEIRRTQFDPAMVSRYASLATYSHEDTLALRAAGIDALHVPLGFDRRITPARTTEGHGVFSFIGAPFHKREAALRTLMDAGLPVRAWGRGWSSHPYDRARTWRLRSSGVPNGRDVPGPQALGIMRNSLGTLNIHGDQDGFTMRTFEASGVGALQFVDRADVSHFYEPGTEIVVFHDDDELVAHARHALARPQDFTALREAARRRTLAEHTLDHRVEALERMWR